MILVFGSKGQLGKPFLLVFDEREGEGRRKGYYCLFIQN